MNEKQLLYRRYMILLFNFLRHDDPNLGENYQKDVGPMMAESALAERQFVIEDTWSICNFNFASNWVTVKWFASQYQLWMHVDEAPPSLASSHKYHCSFFNTEAITLIDSNIKTPISGIGLCLYFFSSSGYAMLERGEDSPA